jgi:signal transduction histidine kinase
MLEQRLNTRASRRRRRKGWLFPLGLFILGGVLALLQADVLLRSGHREQATTQAVQAEALLEGFLRQRASFIGLLQGSIGDARFDQSTRARFMAFARQLERDAPEMRTLLLADETGRVLAAFPDTEDRRDFIGTDLRATPELASVLGLAEARARPTLSGTVELPLSGEGMLIIAPLLEADLVRGFIVSSLAYDAAFSGALAGQLRGQFAHRILDADGRVIARSATFPEGNPGELVERRVEVAGSPPLRVQVAIGAFAPVAQRLLTLGFGSMILVLVAILVAREQAQARRAEERSHQLEVLSRNLLDANLRLEERARQVSEANEAKSRFLANVSHELRTPLNAILGYSALVRDGIYGEVGGDLRSAHDRIGTAGKHLLDLVNDILDLSRIESGRMSVEPEPVPVNSLLEDVLAVVRPMVDAKGLHLRLRVDPALPPIRTDPRHLRQIALNLIVNAVKFTERGRVLVSVRPGKSPDAFILEVADSGIGIAAADQKRIFEEFEQVRPEGRGDSLQRGTGLGLAIVSHLASLLGGRVELRSRPGQGSVFTVTMAADASRLPHLRSNERRRQSDHQVTESSALLQGHSGVADRAGGGDGERSPRGANGGSAGRREQSESLDSASGDD